MKKKKSSLALIILILISITLFLYAIVWINAFLNRTQFNPENVLGNSPGNLINKGLFCEYKDKIYFSNPYDNNSLYVMNPDGSNATLLNPDQANGINVYGSYIFYVRDNKEKTSNFSFLNINTNSLCRTTLNGKKLKILDEDPSKFPSLIGNYIYYQHSDDTNAPSFYRVKIDGANAERLLKDPVNPSGITKNGLYFSNTMENLFIQRFDPITKISSTVHSGDSSFVIPDDTYIYFINCEENYTLYRYDLVTNETEQITTERIDCYNISGDYIYYQTAVDGKYGLYRCDKDGSNPTLIIDGVYNNINVTSEKIYFQKFQQEIPIYCISTDGDLAVSTFQPE